jgi:hypothetical protein
MRPARKGPPPSPPAPQHPPLPGRCCSWTARTCCERVSRPACSSVSQSGVATAGRCTHGLQARPCAGLCPGARRAAGPGPSCRVQGRQVVLTTLPAPLLGTACCPVPGGPVGCRPRPLPQAAGEAGGADHPPWALPAALCPGARWAAGPGPSRRVQGRQVVLTTLPGHCLLPCARGPGGLLLTMHPAPLPRPALLPQAGLPTQPAPPPSPAQRCCPRPPGARARAAQRCSCTPAHASCTPAHRAACCRRRDVCGCVRPAIHARLPHEPRRLARHRRQGVRAPLRGFRAGGPGQVSCAARLAAGVSRHVRGCAAEPRGRLCGAATWAAVVYCPARGCGALPRARLGCGWEVACRL